MCTYGQEGTLYVANAHAAADTHRRVTAVGSGGQLFITWVTELHFFMHGCVVSGPHALKTS